MQHTMLSFTAPAHQVGACQKIVSQTYGVEFEQRPDHGDIVVARGKLTWPEFELLAARLRSAGAAVSWKD